MKIGGYQLLSEKSNKIIQANTKLKIFLVIFSISCIYISLFSIELDFSSFQDILQEEDFVYIQQKYYDKDDLFLINTTGCRIENIDPYDPEVMEYMHEIEKIKCPGDVLTYISKEKGNIYLKINQTLVNNASLVCSYQGVERDMGASRPDNDIIYTTNLIPFTNKTLIKNQTVIRVLCENKYENYHYIFNNEKQSNVTFDETKPNVLLIGLDGMSRSSVLRTMNNTVNFVQENGWINFKAYNKILHNTCPNLMAVTAGLEPQMTGCDDHTNMTWQNYKDFVWDHYKAHNYTTLYSEDFPTFATYNFNKKGFLNAPTDYYLRPYFVALEKLPKTKFCAIDMCFGPENIGLRQLNLIKDYVDTVKNKSNFFGFFWLNSPSHNELSCPTNIDQDVAELFQHLKQEGILDNTVIVFFSDHGFRFGSIVETHAGWLENRLPFIFVNVPKMIRIHHRQKYLNLIQNSDKLTSPYDLFMTLHHILNIDNTSYVVKKPTSGCDSCHSLFEPISDQRTCSDAGIPEYWCTCSKYVKAKKNDTIAQQAAEYSVNYINRLVNGTKCSQYTLNDTLEVKFYKTSGAKIKNVMIRLQLNPPAKFELNLSVEQNKTVQFATSDVERLDKYDAISWCCNEKNLRRYCYCAGK